MTVVPLVYMFTHHSDVKNTNDLYKCNCNDSYYQCMGNTVILDKQIGDGYHEYLWCKMQTCLSEESGCGVCVGVEGGHSLSLSLSVYLSRFRSMRILKEIFAFWNLMECFYKHHACLPGW